MLSQYDEEENTETEAGTEEEAGDAEQVDGADTEISGETWIITQSTQIIVHYVAKIMWTVVQIFWFGAVFLSPVYTP